MGQYAWVMDILTGFSLIKLTPGGDARKRSEADAGEMQRVAIAVGAGVTWKTVAIALKLIDIMTANESGSSLIIPFQLPHNKLKSRAFAKKFIAEISKL